MTSTDGAPMARPELACMVNLGGFLATLLVLAAMGVLLAALDGFTADAFRVAWLVQYPIWALAVVGVPVTRRRARRVAAARDVSPRPLRGIQPHPVRAIASRVGFAGWNSSIGLGS